MPKRPENKPAGVPEWIVTYGDMMSLLLCFFILLAAFSELKKDHEYQRVITAVREAFGYSGGVGVLPINDPPLRSMIEMLEAAARRQMNQSTQSQSEVTGPEGEQTKVSRVEDGLMFTIGGAMSFDPASAVLKEEAKPGLQDAARLLAGKQNKIQIRGHASTKQLPPDSPFHDLRDLSYARARAVFDYLVDECGLDPLTLEIIAVGDTEPVAPRAYSAEAQAVNRRVEIIQTEALVEERNPDPDFSDEGFAQGG